MELPEKPSGPVEQAPPESEGEFPRRPKAEPWTYLNLVIFCIFVLGALFGTFFLGIGVYGALSPVMRWHLSLIALSQNAFFLLGVQLIFYIFVFGYLYALVAFHYRLNFWRAFQWGHLGLRQLSYFVGAGIALTLAVQVAPTVLPDKSHFPLERLLSSPAAAYAVAIFAVLFAPFMEELIFRGFLFSIFERRIGLRTAIWLTAVLFAGLHAYEYQGAWNHLLMIFIVGLVLSLTRGLTHKLAPSVVMHATYNACLMIGLYITSSHFHTLQSAMAII